METKPALLIVDMLNDFVHQDGALTVGEPARRIVPYITATAECYIQMRKPVILVNDLHEQNDREFQKWPPHAVRGTWGCIPYQGIEGLSVYNQREVVTFHKHSYDGFFQTKLGDHLDRLGVNEVHLCGVCTDICIFATAFGAYQRGHKVKVHKMGCASFNQEKHQLFLDHMQAILEAEVV